MCSDRIVLNDDETKFIVIASRNLLRKAAINTIRVGDCDFPELIFVRNLDA